MEYELRLEGENLGKEVLELDSRGKRERGIQGNLREKKLASSGGKKSFCYRFLVKKGKRYYIRKRGGCASSSQGKRPCPREKRGCSFSSEG